MSVVPLYLRMLDDLTPANLFDQEFGLGLLNDDLIAPRHRHIMMRPNLHGYLRNWSQGQSAVSNLKNSKDEFRVNLDVQQFKPEEVEVKVVDNCIVIDGKHEERQDEHGYIQRTFKRRYMLPDDVDASAISSTLSSDGVLSVHAPKKQKAVTGNERSIPIMHTNAPAVKNEPKKNEKQNGETMEQ